MTLGKIRLLAWFVQIHLREGDEAAVEDLPDPRQSGFDLFAASYGLHYYRQICVEAQRAR
ncbi:MAG TPA: hypothetical protein VK869_03390 [Rubrobacteraceae bacterium]|nr:hypothetical protein [Rubrobacteraceae bacterium]